eukprot:g66191.t1
MDILLSRCVEYGINLDTLWKAKRYNKHVWCDEPNTWSDLELLWDDVLGKLHVQLHETPMLATIPLHAPKKLCHNLLQSMFERYHVPALFVAPAPLLVPAAFRAGQSTMTGNIVEVGTSALVIDIGHSSTQMQVLVNNSPVLGACLRKTALS